MSRLSNLCNSRGSMPRKKYSPFAGSSVCSYYSLTKDGTFLVAMFVVSVRRNIFSRNRLPARFPDDVVRVKRSFVQIFDGARSKGRLLQKTKSWLRRLVSLRYSFAIHQIRNYFKRRTLKVADFLNDLAIDLSVLSQEQADGARTHVDVSLTLVVKATANRWLEMPLP